METMKHEGEIRRDRGNGRIRERREIRVKGREREREKDAFVVNCKNVREFTVS